MRSPSLAATVRSASILLAVLLVSLVARGQTPGGNPAAKKIKNPVPATPASVSAGETTFKTFCAPCHGTDAKGNGPLAPPGSNPPDLTDAIWVHGSSDGEIFSSISNGPSPTAKMGAFKAAIAEKDIWNVVNFLRSLGPKTAER
jgi:mono/diheme cytochrome c family protein